MAVKYYNGSETVNGNGRKFSNGRSLLRSGRTRFTSLEGLPRSSAICRALKDI